ncbi:MAG: polymer-forming cytoskeletal protein [Acidobacteria bacterium]|nr:polymer-forming cytoskeletal protein [Acidobacteriota bacterium]
MGRSSRNEPTEAPAHPTNGSAVPNIAQQYVEESQMARPSVVAESESIARDIKEGRLSGFVGHGTKLAGETNFQMMLRVDGHLTGSVTSEGGTLIVGGNGQVDANVSVAVANVNGTVNGDILATEKLHLGRTAHVVGNVATPKLVVEEGAIFEGGCSMIKAIENHEHEAAAQAERYRSSEEARYQESLTDDDEELLVSVDDEETAEAAVL